MKKSPSSVNASCVIIILKPCESPVSPSTRGNHTVFTPLYIFTTYNRNNDADDATQAGQGFPARHHPCRFHFTHTNDAPCRSGLRHCPPCSSINFTLYAGVCL
jgi:hypothetical protein